MKTFKVKVENNETGNVSRKGFPSYEQARDYARYLNDVLPTSCFAEVETED